MAIIWTKNDAGNTHYSGNLENPGRFTIKCWGSRFILIDGNLTIHDSQVAIFKGTLKACKEYAEKVKNYDDSVEKQAASPK